MDTPRAPAQDPRAQPTQVFGGRLSALLLVAGLSGLVGLALTVLPMAAITPLTLALSFAVGQPLCAVALAMYLVAVLFDLKRRKVL